MLRSWNLVFTRLEEHYFWMWPWGISKKTGINVGAWALWAKFTLNSGGQCAASRELQGAEKRSSLCLSWDRHALVLSLRLQVCEALVSGLWKCAESSDLWSQTEASTSGLSVLCLSDIDGAHLPVLQSSLHLAESLLWECSAMEATSSKSCWLRGTSFIF